MLKRYGKTLLITSAVILLPLLAGLLLWNKLPETMATHWGADGTADGWSSKLFAVVGLPLFLLCCQWLCVLISAADPKKQNILQSKGFTLVLWIVPAVTVLCQAAVLCEALGLAFPIDRILPAFMGVLFIIIGNYMPKFRQSYTMGIKLPWTLADEENWQRTHRLGGVVWVIGGVTCIAAGLLKLHIVMGVAFAAMIVIPTVYSYVLYRRKKDS